MRTWKRDRKRWVRARWTVRSHRLEPGERESMSGPWHIVLEDLPGQTWCGKHAVGIPRPQRRSSEPPEGDPTHRRCPDCAVAYELDRPIPRGQTPRYSAAHR